MAEATVLLEIDGPIARMRFNRPQVLNAINDEMVADLRAALRVVRDDPAIRVMVLSGAGRAFMAGGDISAFQGPADEVRMRVREHGAVMPELQRGDGVLIEADLGEAERHYTIKCNVIRRSPETCVLQLEGQIRDGKYCAFSPLDLLELKAGLLNSGK